MRSQHLRIISLVDARNPSAPSHDAKQPRRPNPNVEGFSFGGRDISRPAGTRMWHWEESSSGLTVVGLVCESTPVWPDRRAQATLE